MQYLIRLVAASSFDDHENWDEFASVSNSPVQRDMGNKYQVQTIHTVK